MTRRKAASALPIHMNGRIYDPLLGRFLSADSVIDGVATVQGWNRYSYLKNNPLNATDPTGHFLNFVVGAVIGAAVDTVAQVATSVATGSSLSDAISNVDLKSVGVSAAMGATGVGLGQVFGKAAATVGGKLAMGAIEGGIEGAANGDGIVSSMVGGAAGNIAGDAAGAAVKKVAGAAIDAGGDALKKLVKSDIDTKKLDGVDSQNAPKAEADAPNNSPEITPDELTGKTRTEVRDLADQKGLTPAGDKSSPDYPRKFKDPVTGKERVRLDRGHVDPKTGKPYNNPKAASDHVHGYEADGKTKIKVDDDPHIPTVGE